MIQRNVYQSRQTRARSVSGRRGNGRLIFVASCILLFFGVIIVRLFFVQVLAHEHYQTLADQQHLVTTDQKAQRGEIFARDHTNTEGSSLYLLAANKHFYTIFADPTQITQPVNTADALVEVLGADRSAVLPRLQREHDSYEVIKTRVTKDQLDELKKKNLVGIHWNEEIWREYPDHDIGSQILGFYGIDGATMKGKYGIEGYWNAKLTGTDSRTTVARDPRGTVIPESDSYFQQPISGSDLVLTIDRSIQYEACTVLKRGVEKNAADNASIIIMETRTGRIIAMCNYPSYDPNTYNTVKAVNLFNNNAVFEAYEPGSVMKPIAMSIAIDQGKVTPATIYEDTGEVVIAGKTIHNFDRKAHGIKTMTEVLQESLNTGIIFATQNVRNQDFYEYMQKFGFGKKTDIEISQETAGNLGKLRSLENIYKATVSFGQGITVTPIQLIAAINVIANDGVLMKPFIVDEIHNPDGTIVRTAPKPLRQIIKKETAQTVNAMLTRVLEEGYDHKGSVKGYYLAGKTGTAEIAIDGKYSDMTDHTFVGFGPSNDPKFTVLIKLHRVQNVRFAADSTTPLFAEIAKFLLEYYQIPPTR